MNLQSLLQQNRSGIIEKWLNLTLETYPSDSFNFFKNQKNRFLNPVGSIISSEIETIFEIICDECEIENLHRSLDSIIKIRSVQEMSAGDAVGFIFLLKKVIGDLVSGVQQDSQLFDEYMALDSRIDNAAIIAFECYLESQKRLFEIRANEVRRRYFKVIDRSRFFTSEENCGSDNGKKMQHVRLKKTEGDGA